MDLGSMKAADQLSNFQLFKGGPSPLGYQPLSVLIFGSWRV